MENNGPPQSNISEKEDLNVAPQNIIIAESTTRLHCQKGLRNTPLTYHPLPRIIPLLFMDSPQPQHQGKRKPRRTHLGNCRLSGAVDQSVCRGRALVGIEDG